MKMNGEKLGKMVRLDLVQKYLENVNRYSDVILAFVIIAIIALMILPLNPHIIDTLIALNLTLAILLLMVSLYIKRAVSLYTFPSLLLISTLFRLSLGVATTRQILLNGYAGDIIQTFGEVCVSGNFIVGAIIFIIIMIVQFMVVTKGSERVAEVAARFTLDALPGKQMSVDADLRAGVIDADQAKKKRDLLEKESQLYGSMDGAMKFVKGDAIAGLIINVVNIVGGLGIGVLMKGMTVGEALQTYAILTIGDGLISQIPALFTSVTAGIIVTKVSSESSLHLGADIGDQLLAEPKALYIGGGIVAAFALMPGFPKIPFLFLGLLMVCMGYATSRLPKEDAVKAPPPPVQQASEAPQVQKVRGIPQPLILELHSSLEGSLDPARLWAEMEAILGRIETNSGIPIPSFQMFFSQTIMPGQFVIHLQEVPWFRGILVPGKLLVRESPDLLTLIGPAEMEKLKAQAHGGVELWIPDSIRPQLERARIPHMDHYNIILFQAENMLRRKTHEFLGMHETKLLLDEIEVHLDAMVKEAVRSLTVPKIAEVLQRLVKEEVSIRNIKIILEALVEWAPKEKDPLMLVEHVRAALGRIISHKHSSGTNIIHAWILDAGLEGAIRQSIKFTNGGSFLALPPGVGEKVIESIRKESRRSVTHGPAPVLVTSMDIRRYVKTLLETEMEFMPVLSFQELPKETIIKTLSRIQVAA